jgi:hypothetical protein
MRTCRDFSLQFVGFLLLQLSLVCCPALAQSPSPINGNVLIFPQLVAGGDYVSYITLINVNHSLTISGTLYIYNPDGTPRRIAIDGKPTGSQHPLTIPPGGSEVLGTTPGTTVSIGMAKFISDFPAAGTIRYVNTAGQVGIPGSRPTTVQTVPLTTSNGNDLGLAITNPGTTPVNITLGYIDRAGAIVQTVTPQQLNPLPVNGQISMFVGQYGLNQAVNRSDGTIIIAVTGNSGYFSAAALIMNSAGQYAPTALVDGSSFADIPGQFHGSYTGNWNNTTYGTTGTLSLSMGMVESTQSSLMRITITGNMFGSSAPSPILLYAGYSLSGTNVISASGSDAVLGNYTFTVDSKQKFTFTSTDVPSPNVSGLAATGNFHGDKIDGTYTVNMRPSGVATGNFEMDHTNK